MHKKFIAIAALLGAFTVILGAFATHTLKKVATTEVLQIFETAVKYQMYHVFALMLAGILYMQYTTKAIIYAGNYFIAGIILFSGSLYILCIVKQYGLVYNWVGAITPLGGLCFIMGWLCIAYAVLKSQHQNKIN